MAEGHGTRRAIALDLGGTRYRVAVGTPDGEIEWRVSRATDADRGRDQVLKGMFAAVDEAVDTLGTRSDLSGIGIGAPGPLDPWEGVLYNPPNLPGWDSLPLKKLFEDRYRVPTHVANDANLAAMGEHAFGAGRGFQHVVYVTVSTGIGAGIIIDDRLVLGARGYAGELGHMTIDMRGPLCRCGNTGCLEAIASGTAIATQARELVGKGARTSLSRIPPEQLTAKTVAEAAYEGDEVARELMRNAGQALGVGMVNVAHLFNPQRIILGGGVSMNGGPLLWDPMRETVRARAIATIQRDLEIVSAGLADDSGLLGAVAMVLSRDS